MSSEPDSASQSPHRGRRGHMDGPTRRGRGGRLFDGQLTTCDPASSKRPPARSLSESVYAASNPPSSPISPTHLKGKSTVQDSPSSPISPTHPKGKSTVQDSPDQDGSEQQEICFICAEPFKYYALGICSHRTCHICAIRMRALYKKRDCTFCKTELPNVIFTQDPSSPYSTYDLTTFEYKDAQLSIFCETYQQLTELLGLLKFNCPHPDCSSILANWKELKSHTSSSHGLSLCDLCCANKKAFAHEHSLFTHKGLIVHQNQGSVGAGKGVRSTRPDGQGQTALNGLDDGFKGHPKCEFCATHFYDDDQLYKHCREKHEQCFICVRNEGGRWQYYLDYRHLETHFRLKHHICTHSACLQARFVVFETAFELQSHQVAEHGAEMGMRAFKDARKIETNFVYSTSREQQNQNASNNRPPLQGQVQAMSISPVVSGTGSTLSDANRVVPGLAFGNRVTNETGNRRKDKLKFRSTLTAVPTLGEPSSSGLVGAFDGMRNSVATAATNDLNVQKHAALMRRVEEAVGRSEIKLTSFRSAVKTYRNNEMSASGFLDVISTILDGRGDILGSVVNGLLDLLDIGEDRKTELLKRWKDLRLEQTQFPALDAAGTSRGPNFVANYSNLNLAGISRGPANLSSAGDITMSHFPLPTRTKPAGPVANPPGRDVPGLTPRPKKLEVSATAWSGSGSSSSIPTNTTRVARPPPKPSTNVTLQRPTEANFPSLPINRAIAERQMKKKEVLAQGRSWKSVEGGHQANTSSNTMGSQSTTQNGSDSGAVQAASRKKAKKVFLFTTSRPT